MYRVLLAHFRRAFARIQGASLSKAGSQHYPAPPIQFQGPRPFNQRLAPPVDGAPRALEFQPRALAMMAAAHSPAAPGVPSWLRRPELTGPVEPSRVLGAGEPRVDAKVLVRLLSQVIRALLMP